MEISDVLSEIRDQLLDIKSRLTILEKEVQKSRIAKLTENLRSISSFLVMGYVAWATFSRQINHGK